MSRTPPESDSESRDEAELKEDELFCSICMEHYKVGETVAFCVNKNIFHSDCLYSWMHVAANAHCPLCRSSIGAAEFRDGPKVVEYRKDCLPCLLSELENVVHSLPNSTRFRTLRLVGDEKRAMLDEQERFRREGPDYDALTRSADLIHNAISNNQIVDFTAACGTGKSTILPIIVMEMAGVDRVYVLEPRKQVAVENAFSSNAYRQSSGRAFIDIGHCTKNDELPQIKTGITFFSAGKLEQLLKGHLRTAEPLGKVVIMFND